MRAAVEPEVAVPMKKTTAATQRVEEAMKAAYSEELSDEAELLRAVAVLSPILHPDEKRKYAKMRAMTWKGRNVVNVSNL